MWGATSSYARAWQRWVGSEERQFLPELVSGGGTTGEAVVEGPVAPSPSVRPAACDLPETSSGRNFGSRHLDRHFPIERGPLPQRTPGRAGGGAQLVNADLLAVGGARGAA